MKMRFAILATFVLAGTSAHAGDFGPLMDVVRQTWPGRTHIAVVADYASSRDEIQELADAAGEGALITVLDIHDTTDPWRVPRTVLNRLRPDYVVLLSRDPVFREGSPVTTWLVGQTAQAGLPSVGTTPMAVRQGAVFAVGAGTGNELMVNPEIKGSIHVVLPVRETLRPVARVTPLGHAEIRRIAMVGR